MIHAVNLGSKQSGERCGLGTLDAVGASPLPVPECSSHSHATAAIAPPSPARKELAHDVQGGALWASGSDTVTRLQRAFPQADAGGSHACVDETGVGTVEHGSRD